MHLFHFPSQGCCQIRSPTSPRCGFNAKAVQGEQPAQPACPSTAPLAEPLPRSTFQIFSFTLQMHVTNSRFFDSFHEKKKRKKWKEALRHCATRTDGSWSVCRFSLATPHANWLLNKSGKDTCTQLRPKFVPLFHVGKQTACHNLLERIKTPR